MGTAALGFAFTSGCRHPLSNRNSPYHALFEAPILNR